ncbi:MAG: hypothetical protein ACOY71_13075, partial [Gemmatimonadota bacterium]
PLVAVSAGVLLLAPGLLLVRGFRGVVGAGDWVLRSLAVSIGLVSAAATIAQVGFGVSLRGRAFGLLVVGLAAAAFAASLLAARPEPGRFSRADRHALVAMLVLPAGLTAVLAPKFLWESFNGDGSHAYEAARLLLSAPGPFWPPEAGGVATYPGLKTFLVSYPLSWFLRLFGETEASVRLPFLLFLAAGVHAGVVALIDVGRAARGAADRWLVWIGLVVFTLVMAYSATYSPYSADLALPGAADALFIAWFLGLAWAFLTGRFVWVAAFALLTYATSPGGLVLVALWLGATMLVVRPRPLRPAAVALGMIVLCLLAERAGPAVLGALGLPAPGTEHGTGTLAERLLRVQWTDWKRFIYVIVPCGIAPALAVLAWRKQDPVARAVTLVALAQFAFFFVQARVSLHYFAPAMVLPLVVYWRIAGQEPGPVAARYRWAAVAGGLVAAGASLPGDLRPFTAAREVGMTIEDRIGGYDRSNPEGFRAAELLHELFPTEAGRQVPDRLYGGSHLQWLHYANRPGGRRQVNYVLQRAGDPPPPGMRLAAARNGAALYMADDSVLARQQVLHPGSSIARIYRISRRTLFRG